MLSAAEIDAEVFYDKKTNMNRYSDIWACIPFPDLDEHSRVKIPQLGEEYYINANEVRSLVDGKVFTIFGQAPVAPFDNFWEAAYYKNVILVVMLCMFVDPKRGRQSEPYWPEIGKTALFSNGKISVTAVDQK